MKRTLITIALLATFSPAFGQVNYGVTKEQKEHADELTQVHDKIAEAEHDGVSVRMKDIGRFRGVRANMLQGFGLVIGLAGTGDSQQTQLSAPLLENALKRWGT
ncbi:MAG TPA: flagellar basal body P-ring protein FlgI, partial [Fimbriimonadaceae bacterium]|nr:flagellar basal body P-ring protein FlgI [Fimbriimonadaceae bacterium]